MRDIAIDQAATVLQRGATVIDVREPGEFHRGHLPGAVSIPMGQLPARRDELDPAQPVYVVCATGNRSGAMVDLLTASGFDAVNVAGGIAAWVRSGLPIEK